MRTAILICAALAIIAREECDCEDPVIEIEYEYTETYNLNCAQYFPNGAPEPECINDNSMLIASMSNTSDPSGSKCRVTYMAIPCHGCDVDAEDPADICEEQVQ